MLLQVVAPREAPAMPGEQSHLPFFHRGSGGHYRRICRPVAPGMMRSGYCDDLVAVGHQQSFCVTVHHWCKTQPVFFAGFVGSYNRLSRKIPYDTADEYVG